jgi:hypothetical protein
MLDHMAFDKNFRRISVPPLYGIHVPTYTIHTHGHAPCTVHPPYCCINDEPKVHGGNYVHEPPLGSVFSGYRFGPTIEASTLSSHAVGIEYNQVFHNAAT